MAQDEDRVPTGMRPEDVVSALAEYVDFDGPDARPAPPSAPSGDVAMVRKGLSRGEMERLFGEELRKEDERFDQVALPEPEEPPDEPPDETRA